MQTLYNDAPPTDSLQIDQFQDNSSRNLNSCIVQEGVGKPLGVIFAGYENGESSNTDTSGLLMANQQLQHLSFSGKNALDPSWFATNPIHLQNRRSSQGAQCPQTFMDSIGQRPGADFFPFLGVYCPIVTWQDIWFILQDVLLLSLYAVLSCIMLR